MSQSNCQPEPEAGTQPDEVRSGGLAVAGCAQTEEGMVLHSTLPQVLAGARTVQPEHEGVLLLTPLRRKQRSSWERTSQGCRWPAARGTPGSETYLVIILHYYEGQFALFKVHFGDLRPKE